MTHAKRFWFRRRIKAVVVPQRWRRVAISRATPARRKNRLRVERVFSDPKVKPFDQIEWDRRTAEITDDAGKVIFKQENVEVPKSWSLLATKVVVSKYFYGEQNTPERETSVRQLIHRISRTIADWGIADGYFSKADGEIFYEELTWLCVNQYGAFNSPVWFNVGLFHEYGIGKKSGKGNWFYNRKTRQAERATTQYEYPQGSACFIQSVQDNMEDIMRLAYSEAMLFKYGSGTGTDLTPIRSSKEKFSGGGRPSGPMSFLKVYDQVANVVKSGGKTRRAAKMNTLRDWHGTSRNSLASKRRRRRYGRRKNKKKKNVVKSGGKTRRAAKMNTLRDWHGDIEEFIDAKQKEEKKAWALIEQGYDGSYNGDAYGSVMYQNENLSVRASDEFMQAALAGKEWWTRSITTGKPLEKKDAAKLLYKIAEGTWICGDPGMQYDGAIQKWHTCKGTEPIHSTNPCSEYVFINNTACNLASLNLMKFKREDGKFDVERFKAAVRIFITAQEILVDNASYPTKDIAENSHIFRTLGLGFANLGSLCMSYGLPYDSDEGRALAGAITAIMTGHAYEQSAEIAANIGAFPGYRDARCAHVSQAAGEGQRRIHARRHSTASRRRRRNPAEPGIQLFEGRGAQNLGRRARQRPPARLPQRAGHRARADRHHRVPDGLRHDRRRTRHRAGQIQAARRRRHVEDRQSRRGAPRSPMRCAASVTARRKSKASSRTSKNSTRLKTSRKTAQTIAQRPQAGASAGVRLRVQAVSRQAQHPLPGALENDGRRAAVHQRRDFQDRQHAERMHRRGNPRHLRSGVEDGAEMRGDLPRRLEAFAAAQHQKDQ